EIVVTNSQGQSTSATVQLTVAAAGGSADVVAWLIFSPRITRLNSSVGWLDANNSSANSTHLTATVTDDTASPNLSGTWTGIDTPQSNRVVASSDTSAQTSPTASCAGSFAAPGGDGLTTFTADFTATSWEPARCLFAFRVSDDPSALGAGDGVYSNANTAT